MISCRKITIVFLAVLFVSTAVAMAAELAGHWRLIESDCSDLSGNGNHGVNHGVDLSGSDGAVFDGIEDYIEVPNSESLNLGTEPFSISVWIHTDAKLNDVLGDILEKFDPKTRTGVTLSLMNYAGVTNAQSNYRNLSFGIDAGHGGISWVDCGRPGNNRHVRSLVVFDGDLYASTWEPAKGERGHVYRYAGGKKWVDCGSPDKSNAIAGMAVCGGRLYVGSELYPGGGSALPESPNNNPAVLVFCYEGGNKWADCGKPDERLVSRIGLIEFEGKLYAGTGTTGSFRKSPRTMGMYRYDGDKRWPHCGCPGRHIGTCPWCVATYGKSQLCRFRHKAYLRTL